MGVGSEHGGGGAQGLHLCQGPRTTRLHSQPTPLHRQVFLSRSYTVLYTVGAVDLHIKKRKMGADALEIY